MVAEEENPQISKKTNEVPLLLSHPLKQAIMAPRQLAAIIIAGFMPTYKGKNRDAEAMCLSWIEDKCSLPEKATLRKEGEIRSASALTDSRGLYSTTTLSLVMAGRPSFSADAVTV